jgi:Tfp pilus assembly protein PilE
MKRFLKYIKSTKGQSLAEFAVTTAMMATLATTAAPKFSGVGEGAKEKKTLADIDKIMKSANNFYNAKVTGDGRGRFPGQDKYNETVPATGGYATEAAALADIKDAADGSTTASFTTYDSDDASHWASVFSTTNTDATAPTDHNISTSEDDDNDGSFDEYMGAEEFLNEFGGNAVKSPFQDGHYIYTVIAGSGSGTSSISPILFIADLESAKNFHKKLQP